jgi:hypothetical protein
MIKVETLDELLSLASELHESLSREPWTTLKDEQESVMAGRLKHGLANLGTHLYQPLDAQAYCGVSAQTINKWRKEGWLKASAQSGRGYLYTKEALNDTLRMLGKAPMEVI